MKWSLNSWKNYPISQQPSYSNEDLQRLDEIVNQIRQFPAIVTFDEIDNLKKELTLVNNGEAFILQGGDCAEAFDAFSTKNLDNYLRLFLQMNAVLMYGVKKPIIKIGRIAGQFAKPRSNNTETFNDTTYPAYRGDIVNDISLDLNLRKPNPERLLQTYFYSAATCNYLRGLTKSGFASLNKIAEWNRQFLEETSAKRSEFQQIVEGIEQNLRFLEACRFNTQSDSNLNEAIFYTSHEALILNYESALVRQRNTTGKNYCLSAHLLWIGDRTRKIDEAHVEFLSGIENPIGIKVGPKTDVDELLRIIDKLNPQNSKGKIVLISRMGAGNLPNILPSIIQRVSKEGKNVIWQCDPMHGNTIKAENGYKTRRLNDIMQEINEFIDIHKSLNIKPSGIHLEMTGNNVTECLGGLQNIQEMNLAERYRTHCDPRVNSVQSLEIAFFLSDKLKDVFK